MVFALAAIGALIWGALIFGILYVKHTPRAQVRRRILTMIEQAESEREKVAEQKKKSEPKPVKKISLHRTFYARIIQPIISGIVNTLNAMTPPAIISSLEQYVFRAGVHGKWSVERVAALWILSVAAGLWLTFIAVQYTNYLLTQEILIVLLGGVIGGLFPFFVLKNKIRSRQKMLRRQLPDFMDLLCVSVQAGLSFDGAVAKITVRLRNTLSDEFKRMQDDVRFGMTKQYALTQMAKRCDIEEVYLFTTSIIQAEKLGTSMTQTLTLQADNMRDRHRQFVRAEAMKAPVKMLFPMVMFIFPAIFVVLLMPSVITLIKTLGK
ncbi:MAG: type II secretion system F family protein [Selenomonadaceae bacterium]|nr:type II secretion system F family protein [Selenomonadaceae bacterium]